MMQAFHKKNFVVVKDLKHEGIALKPLFPFD